MGERNGGGLVLRTVRVLALPVASVVVALLIGAVLIALQGKSPLSAYVALWKGAAGDLGSVGASLARAVPLTLAALGIALSFRCGVFNIGAEGQLFLAAMASTWVGTHFVGLPAYLHLPLALLGGFLTGGIYALIPGWLKVRRGFNEIITTILLNYLATNFVSYAVHGPFKDPKGYSPQSAAVATTARLPRLLQGSELHSGVFLVLLAAVLVYWLLYKTVLGYQMRAVGGNPQAAGYGGIPVSRVIVIAMLLSGGIAGLAGSSEILGTQYRLLEGFATNLGYDAIAVALLGRLNPVGILLSGLFFGALRNGAQGMQILTGIPVTIIEVIQAVVILCVLAGSYAQLKPFFRRRKGGAASAETDVAPAR